SSTHVRVWRLARVWGGRRPTMTVTVFDRGRNARPGTSSIDPPARARSFRRERVKECYHLAMEYRRAFARAVRQQPWWQWLAVIMFDLFNLSAADYLRLWRGLGLTAKDVLWTSALFLTALLIYRIGADAWRELHEQNAELEVRTKPRLQIAFDPDKYPTCLQQNEWQDPDGTRVVDRLFRVGIINISVAETVDDVEVMLAELIGLGWTKTGTIPVIKTRSSPRLAITRALPGSTACGSDPRPAG